VAQPPLTARRLLGLDRSGPPPSQTLRGAPLNPWTVPNAIGLTRLALVPVFFLVAMDSGDGRSALAATLYAVIGGTDYLDGVTARLTGQYSRLGALIDPLTDRLLVVSGVVVAWQFELLPRPLLAVLAARELLTLVLSELALRRGLEIEIKMIGRWAVWPTMFSIFLAMISTTWVAVALLILGLVMTLWATALYLRDARRALRANGTPSSSG
jgi:cardiolipin synthase